MMTTRLGVLVMSGVLVLYLVAVVQLSVSLISAPDPLAQAIGVALIVLPVIGAWALAAELMFGVRSQKLAKMLEGEGALPADELPTRASGRIDRAAADDLFPRYRQQVEQHPDDWRSWFRLGLAYDASGDRRRARRAIRRAIALERTAR